MTLRVSLYLVILPVTAVWGQDLMDKAVRLYPGDTAILEGHEIRADLNCRLKAIAPELGFDLSLHTGYEVTVPFEGLAGNANMLTAIFRVIPAGHKDDAIYFSQSWKIPPLADNATGIADLRGKFEVGEGKYEVEWLMRDRDERYCSAQWEISADRPRGKDSRIELRLARGEVAAETESLFLNERPVKRDTDHALKVLVLLHVASQSSGASGMRASETTAVFAILRSIAREPRIGSYSITAFNLERNKVVFRREDAPEIDFPELGKAIKGLQLGTIDVRNLRGRDEGVEFLGALLTEEVGKEHPDALIFIGPKTKSDFGVRGTWKDMDVPLCPVFYLDYNADPVANPWRDSIGSVVKFWKGFEYTITRPRDVFAAWNEVMKRMTDRERATGEPFRRVTVTGLVPKK